MHMPIAVKRECNWSSILKNICVLHFVFFHAAWGIHMAEGGGEAIGLLQ